MKIFILLQSTVHKSYQQSPLYLTGGAMQMGLNQMHLASQELARPNGTYVT